MNSTRLKGILLVLNILAGMAVAGVLVYTKLIFKRPAITESQERTKIEEGAKLKGAKVGEQRALVKFNRLQINLKAQQSPSKTGTQVIGTKNTIDNANPQTELPIAPLGAHSSSPSGPISLRFLSVAFSLEVRDTQYVELIEERKTVITDLMISALGQKDFYEITTVQGRYVLRAQLVEAINDLLAGKQDKSTQGFRKDSSRSNIIVTNIYFTDFTAQ